MHTKSRDKQSQFWCSLFLWQ